VRDRGPDVLVGDVAEDAAREHEVRRHRSVDRIRDPGVGRPELDPEEAERGDPLAAARRELGRELDEAGPDVAGPRMVLEHAEEVPPVPRTEAHDADRTRRCRVEHRADTGPNDRQPSTEVAAPVVAPVPGDPLVRHGRPELWYC